MAIKCLSFSGRVQLLSSVIIGTINFWISTFILPKGCIKKIESLCSRFLWSGNIENLKVAKVSWSTVCLPKAEGGLGLRRFSVWNRALCFRFIWLLFSTSDSLWVAWQRFYHLGNQSFWEVQQTNQDSWTWKQLLKLRKEALSFVKAVLGDGKVISFWYDVWTLMGQLITYMGLTGPISLRVPINAKFADTCSPNGWKLASPRS